MSHNEYRSAVSSFISVKKWVLVSDFGEPSRFSLWAVFAPLWRVRSLCASLQLLLWSRACTCDVLWLLHPHCDNSPCLHCYFSSQLAGLISHYLFIATLQFFFECVDASCHQPVHSISVKWLNLGLICNEVGERVSLTVVAQDECIPVFFFLWWVTFIALP